jgi:hypothetical protein
MSLSFPNFGMLVGWPLVRAGPPWARSFAKEIRLVQ